MSIEPGILDRRNVEQKFRCADLEAARAAALAAGAVHAETMVQRDIYFRVPRGRLKLRTIESDVHGQSSELIAYNRPDGEGERTCNYQIVRVSDSQSQGIESLLAAVLDVRVIVNKRRRLLLSDNLRIHLDEVDGMGSFVEFEAVLGPGDSEDGGRREVARWRTLLGLQEPVAVSYVDLMEGQSEAPSHPSSRREANLHP